MRIMIAEDEEKLADALVQIFAKNKMTADAFENGIDALDNALTGIYDVIVLDIMMPGMNGIEVLRKIREKNLPLSVIMVTAANDSAAIEEAVRLGVVDYLIKPFSGARFQQALEKFLSRQDAFHDLESFSQQHIDAILSSGSSKTIEQLPKGIQDQTLETVRNFLERNPDTEFTGEEIADKVGLSRVTVRRYMNFLLEKGEISGNMNYETGGRPCMLYKVNK